MCNLTREEEILLREYGEAGQLFKLVAQLRRAGLVIFIAIESAIIGFIQTRPLKSIENIPMEIFAILVGVATFNSEFRLACSRNSIMKRFKEIEDRLKMTVYTNTENDLMVSKTIPNKNLFPLIPIFLIVYLISLIVIQIYYSI